MNLEIRSNKLGLLERLDLPISAQADQGDRPGAISLVIDDPSKKVRRLPSLYLASALVFADRDVAKVLDRLSRTLEAIETASTRSVYAFHACRVGESIGLYGRDLYNRDPYRRKLRRQGVEFASDSHVVLEPDGRFTCEDWGTFVPSFLVLAESGATPEEVVTTGDAGLAFALAIFRFGSVSVDELQLLVRVSRALEAVSAIDPGALVEHLTRSSV